MVRLGFVEGYFRGRTMPGQCVLIVEDECLIAMMIEDMVLDLGHSVAGVACTVAEAFKILDMQKVDVALLDINLGHELVWPIALHLQNAGQRYAFLSSDTKRDDFPEICANAPRFAKPVYEEDISKILDESRLVS